jgi:hypothetical protein
VTRGLQVQFILPPTVSRPVRLGVRPPCVAHDQIFITLGHLRSSCCGAPFLTRRRVCNLLVQFTVILGPKSRRTHDHSLRSHLKFPQPGGPGSRIYISQEQGGPVIPPGTGFPFCRLLRLAGQRWRCSNQSPDGSQSCCQNSKTKSQSKLYYDRQLVGQSVFVSGTHLGPATNFSPLFHYL